MRSVKTQLAAAARSVLVCALLAIYLAAKITWRRRSPRRPEMSVGQGNMGAWEKSSH